MPGPAPQREEDLAEPRRPGRGDVTKGVARKVTVIPDYDPDWHPIAIRLYESLWESGQKDFYQNSDWALAYSICEDLSYLKKSGKRSGEMLKTIYSSLERLLVTEADRRRLRIELDAPEEQTVSEGDIAIDYYKNGLGIVREVG